MFVKYLTPFFHLSYMYKHTFQLEHVTRYVHFEEMTAMLKLRIYDHIVTDRQYQPNMTNMKKGSISRCF